MDVAASRLLLVVSTQVSIARARCLVEAGRCQCQWQHYDRTTASAEQRLPAVDGVLNHCRRDPPSGVLVQALFLVKSRLVLWLSFAETPTRLTAVCRDQHQGVAVNLEKFGRIVVKRESKC